MTGGGVSRFASNGGNTSDIDTVLRPSSNVSLVVIPFGGRRCFSEFSGGFSLSKSHWSGTIGSLKLWLCEYPLTPPFE